MCILPHGTSKVLHDVMKHHHLHIILYTKRATPWQTCLAAALPLATSKNSLPALQYIYCPLVSPAMAQLDKFQPAYMNMNSISLQLV